MVAPPHIIISIPVPAGTASIDEDGLQDHAVIIIFNASASFTISSTGHRIPIGGATGLMLRRLTACDTTCLTFEDNHLQVFNVIPSRRPLPMPICLSLRRILAGLCVVRIALRLQTQLLSLLCPTERSIACNITSQADRIESIATIVVATVAAVIGTLDQWNNLRQLRNQSRQVAERPRRDNPIVDSQDIEARLLARSRPSLSDRADVCPISKNLRGLEGKRIPETAIRFSAVSYVAQGSSGEVHCAKLDGRDEAVAVKVFRHPENAVRRSRAEISFAHEVRVWSELDHPNILPLAAFSHNCAENVSWLVSPFIQEGNVKEYLERTQPGMDVRLRLAVDTAAGLAYLHERKTCHGDLKPANVLVDVVEGSPKALLCDFGLSEVRESQVSGLLTSSFDRKGSARYFGPELVCENPRRDLQSDVWAWGCVLLEITTDIIPYNQVKDHSVVVFKIIANEPPAVLEDLYVHETTRALLERCWSSAAERPHMWECHKILLKCLQ